MISQFSCKNRDDLKIKSFRQNSRSFFPPEISRTKTAKFDVPK